MLKLIGQNQPQHQPQFGKVGIQRVSSPIYQLHEGNRPYWVIPLYYPSYCLTIKHIYYFIFKTYMHPSFQSSTYTHSFQSQIHGPSGLKVFDGEDLSNYISIQPVEIEKDYSSCSQTSGGGSRRRRSKGGRRWSSWRRIHSTSRQSKSTSIGNSWRRKSKSALEIWKSPTSKPICSNYKKRLASKRCRGSYRPSRNLDTSNMLQATTSSHKTQ